MRWRERLRAVQRVGETPDRLAGAGMLPKGGVAGALEGPVLLRMHFDPTGYPFKAEPRIIASIRSNVSPMPTLAAPQSERESPRDIGSPACDPRLRAPPPDPGPSAGFSEVVRARTPY
jgi:hypothetical protein